MYVCSCSWKTEKRHPKHQTRHLLAQTDIHTSTHTAIKLQKQTRNIVACQLYAKPKDKTKKNKNKNI